MEREKKLFKNTIILFIGTFIPSFTSIITLPLYTSYLTKVEYGTYDLLTILISIFVPIVTFQIQQAAFRYIIDSKQENIKFIISNTYFFIIPILSIGIVILYLGLYKISNQVRLLICIYICLETLMNVTRQIVRGLGDTKNFSISAIVNAFSNMVFAVVFLFIFRLGLNGLLLSLSLSIFISFFCLFKSVNIFENVRIQYLDIKLIKRLLNYSFPLVPNMISMWIVNLSDRMVITWMMGLEATAIYAIANKIPNLFSKAYNTFNMAWQESASLEVNKDDTAEYYSKIMNGIYDFVFSIMALIIGFMPLIFKILINSSYDEAYYQMPILMLATLFSCINAFYGGIYIGIKETKKVGVSTFWASVLNLTLNIIFIKQFGLFAASLSTLISFLISLIYRAIDIQKRIKLKYNFRKIIICLFFNVLLLILCYRRKPIINIFNCLLSIWFAFSISNRLLKVLMDQIRRKI